ncbi:MAG: hypothetical protein EPN97_01300 [Alphaproteobacteria bacterium]|nr:MAG: hypothetical protein EPN97_01300 [Alphaproteobacteria bacterium]
MARQSARNEPRRAQLSIDEKMAAIPKLQKRIADLNAFDPAKITRGDDPKIEALEHSIASTLDEIFDSDTVQRDRLRGAERLDDSPIMMGGTPLHETITALKEGKERAIVLLDNVIKGFKEDIDSDVRPATTASKPKENTRKVFIVHGHDDGAKETVARYLQKLNLQPIILHEQPSEGKTVIEKFEAHSDVDFAVVLLTPDDVGGKTKDTLEPRARQNVILELGFFMGKLGRKKVRALKKDNVQVPSDYDGVIYIPMTGDWKGDLAREIDKEGIEIDFNLVYKG